MRERERGSLFLAALLKDDNSKLHMFKVCSLASLTYVYTWEAIAGIETEHILHPQKFPSASCAPFHPSPKPHTTSHLFSAPLN